MVRLFRLMLFVMLAAVGVESNDEIVALRELKPPNIASNVLRSVMETPPIPDITPSASEPVVQWAPLVDSRAVE